MKSANFRFLLFFFLRCGFFCSFSVGQLMRWLIDHERYVVIRKSSMENVHAKQIYENYRRKIRRISLVNAPILDTLLALLLMIFVVNGGSRTLVEIEKVQPTPDKYPRSNGKIKSKPL